MDYGIQGRVTLVAAASKGLGKACALGLAREGARVAICARNEAVLKQTAEEISTATGWIGISNAILSRRFRSQPSGSRRLEQQQRQHARLGAALRAGQDREYCRGATATGAPAGGLCHAVGSRDRRRTGAGA